MSSQIPSWWFFVGGIISGAGLVLLIFIPIALWAGFPRKRERELERDLCDAWKYIEELREEDND